MKSDPNIKCEMICDSTNEFGVRLPTVKGTFPNIILPQVLTHRMFSRNTTSSRAKPTSKLLEEVRNNMYVPQEFTKNNPGMSGKQEPFSKDHQEWLQTEWICAGLDAADRVERMMKHAEGSPQKQLINRPLHPYLYSDMLITSTDFDHFLTLRLGHENPEENPQPEIIDFAEKLQKCLAESIPVLVIRSESHSSDPRLQSHLPYINSWDVENNSVGDLYKISVARSARISYRSFNSDNRSSSIEDMKLYYKLVLANPPHLSPTEHVAFPNFKRRSGKWYWTKKSNFDASWHQYRKDIE